MAGRRRGTQLLTSIYRAVEAQLATASSQSFTCPQLTSLYSDLLQPQHLTCLRHFNTSSTPLFTTTTSVAEGVASNSAKAVAKAPRKFRASSKAKKADTKGAAGQADGFQPVKPPRKSRSSAAKSNIGEHQPQVASEQAAPKSDSFQPLRTPRSSADKPGTREPQPQGTSAQAAAKSPRKAWSAAAKSAAKEPQPQAASGEVAAKSGSAQAAKPSREPRATSAKSSVRKPRSVTANAAARAAASHSSPDASDPYGVDMDTASEASSHASDSSASSSASGQTQKSIPPHKQDLTEDLKQPPAQTELKHMPVFQDAPAIQAASTDAADASTDIHADAGADAKQPEADATQRSLREVRKARRVQSRSRQEESAQPRFALPSYKELKAQMQGDRLAVRIPLKSRKAMQTHMRAFQGSARVQDQALALYVNSQLFFSATNELEAFMLKAASQELVDALVKNEPGPAAEDALFGLFAEYVVHNYSAELQAYRKRVQTVDMRQSHKWYPVARALQRKIIYHAGPTNSGKTYQALKAMREAKTGIYCGPLRLLAMEVFDSVNQQGIHCNLHTGQERQVLAGAKHVSCTIEMISTTKQWDCAVIDEIQMIGDDQRGWAWTRALQGLPANEIHLCGDASALPLIKQMCDDMAEPLTVISYNRFTTLEIQPNALRRQYASVKPGDCIVAFSRRDIFDIKTDIERRTKHKCCVIYGALPPEMRRHQAELFNEPENGFDILVASDAVGMGLNLNIRRVIFHKVQKFEGKESVPVSNSQIKQIAGRAGRRSSIYPQGYVGTRVPEHLHAVTNAVNMPLTELSTPAAGLFPEFQHLELLAGQVPNDSFAKLLNRFSDEAKLEGTFFFCRQDGVMQIAKLLEQVDNLSLEDRFDFCLAPANIRDSRMAAALLHYAARYAHGLPATLDIALPKAPPTTTEELRHIEATHQVMSLWIWLSHRFGPEAFPGLEEVAIKSDALIALMNKGLEQLCALNKRKGKPKGPQIPKLNGREALLLEHEPLALAYLANARDQKLINNFEWTGPNAQVGDGVQWQEFANKQAHAG